MGKANHKVLVDDTYNPEWKYHPEWRTRVRVNGQSFLMNHKEYWNDFLLCEPYPDQILEVKEVSRCHRFGLD